MAGKVHIEWQHSERQLKELYQQETDHQDRTRLQALWLVRSGRTVSESAAVVGVHRTTLQTWLGWYREGGVEEVYAHRHGGQGGPARRLSAPQEAELVELAMQGEIRTIWDGVMWAQSQHAVDYTYDGMRWVFERLELKKKVPRPRSTKASEAKQTAWKKGGS